MESLCSTRHISEFNVFQGNPEQEQKKVSKNQVSVQLHKECGNVQQTVPVQAALVLLLFDTICDFTPPPNLCLLIFGLTPLAGCALEHC
jgi:hypothetical protein